MPRRVVVTGLGLVIPQGKSVAEAWPAVLAGEGRVDRISRFDPSTFDTQIAAEVRDFDPEKYLEKKEARRMDRFTQFAVVAASEAVADAGLDRDRLDPHRAGVIIGTGIGGIETHGVQHRKFLEGGAGRVSPFFVIMLMANSASGYVSIRYGLRGPNYCTVSACASSAHAVGDAFRLIKWGDADLMVCGGAEACITPLALDGFCSTKALSTRNHEPHKACRPFDAQRDGFVMGEGAGIVILEELEHAQARGAKIYAEVVGYGMSSDAFHMTQPVPDGMGAIRCMKLALQEGGLDPEEVDYINAHGTSTPFNDRSESKAVAQVFGEHAYRLAVSSTKSMTGHTLGAAGGIEFAITALAIRHSRIPPTINYEFPDPECDLDYVPNRAREAAVRAALTNSFGFGGHNVTLALKPGPM